MDSLIFKRGAEVSLRSRFAIYGGFGLIALAAVAAIIIAVSATHAEQQAARSLAVRQANARLFSMVQDAETGQRGYLLTGDLSYLQPFEDAEERLPAMEAELARLIADASPKQGRLAILTDNIDRKMRELERTIARRKAGDAAGALAIVNTNEGRDIMRRIRAASVSVDRAERERVEARQKSAARLRSLLIAAILLALVTSALLAYLVASAARRHAAEILGQNEALVRERSNREHAEGMLRQAQKMEALGQLTGGVAHDFNNMLAIIVGSLDMMLRRMTDADPRLRTMAENALSGANRAAGLTKRLLAFSRLLPLDPKPVDVNRCVSDMSEMLRRTLGEHIAVETVLAGGLWRAFVDSPQLESAILNLAVNARDAMGEAGRLTIETSNSSLDKAYAEQHAEVDPGQYVLIAVTDTGSGMSAEVMSKAFDPFFTTKKVGEGTGLGLSQVHGFLKQSRGHIKIYSEAGHGTTVKLYVPRDISGGPLPSDSTRVGSAERDRAVHTVLIVEDDPGVRSFVVSAARELGYGVVEADSAALALERLDAHPEITILLTDVVMPGATGRQLADLALERRADLPVIYMTGYTRNAIVHNGTLDPGTRLLTKPFTLEELDRELLDVITGNS